MGAAPSAGTATTRRALAAASIGTFVEGYDLALYGFFAVVMSKQFFPPEDPTAALLATFAIFALGFAARPLGGVIFGHIGDRTGRRPALAASVLSMAVGTVIVAVLPTYPRVGVWASVLLLACRLLQGMSIGGEVAGGNVFVLEHAEPRWSGRAVSANLAGNSMGFAVAAVTSLLTAAVLDAHQLATWGWRVPFALAAPLGLIGLYLRSKVPDTPVFQAAGAARPPLPLLHAARTASREMLLFAGFAATVLLGGYLLITYLPSYLTQVAALSTRETFAATLGALAMLAAGIALGGILVDLFPARVVASGCTLAVAVTAVPGLLLVKRGTLALALLGLGLWAVVLGVGNTVGAWLSLILFPPPIRYTATALSLNVTAAVFGGAGPYVSTWLVRTTGNPIAPAVYLTVIALGSLVVAVRLPRTGVAPARPPRKLPDLS